MLVIVTLCPTVPDTSVLPRSTEAGLTWSSAWPPSGLTDVASGSRRTGATGSSQSTATTPTRGPGIVASNCTSTEKSWLTGTLIGRGVRTVNSRDAAVSCVVVMRMSVTVTTRFDRFHRMMEVDVWLPSTWGVGSQR